MSALKTDELRALAAAADKNGQHIYTHWRDSNAHKANELWCRAASPELVVGLLDRIAELEAKHARKQMTRSQIWDAIRPLTSSDEYCAAIIDISMDEYRAIERAHGITQEPQ